MAETHHCNRTVCQVGVIPQTNIPYRKNLKHSKPALTVKTHYSKDSLLHLLVDNVIFGAAHKTMFLPQD